MWLWKWWKFAITSVIKSIRFKKGAIHAFKIPKEELSTYETKFKPKFKQLYLCSTDLEKENLINVTWQENQRKEFWNITSMASQETLTQWINSVVEPIERAKIEQKS